MVDKISGQVRYAVLCFVGFPGMGHDHYLLPRSMLPYDVKRGGYVVDLDKPVLENTLRYTAGQRPDYDAGYGHNIYQYHGLIYPFEFFLHRSVE